MKNFTRKGYGRIYVQKQSEIEEVKKVIEEMDSFEFDYLPDDFITTFKEYPSLIHTHKFSDLDINVLTGKCWSRGIFIWCLDNGTNESFTDKG